MSKKKRKIKSPHLFWIMVMLLVLGSILTYIVPAGRYEVDSNGNILHDQFNYLGHQTPVNLYQAMLLILEGLKSSSSIIFTIMATGATISVLLETGAVSKLLDWTINRFSNLKATSLVAIVYIAMTFISGFAGSAAMVAMVPIGVLVAKKLKLDSISAVAMIHLPAVIGFGTGPNCSAVLQLMADVVPFSGTGVRMLMMVIFMVPGLLFLIRYIDKIQKDPSNSLVFQEKGDYSKLESDVSEVEVSDKLGIRTILVLLVFAGMFISIIVYGMRGGENPIGFMAGINLVTAAVMGVVGGLSMDEIGDSIASGITSMAWIAYVLGLASAFSTIMQEGNIVDTIAHAATAPLSAVGGNIANVVFMVIVFLITIVISSTTGLAAILLPIVLPITNLLKIPNQVVTYSFLMGNMLALLVSPTSGWTMGSLDAAGVSFDKWVKWFTPLLVVFLIMAAIIIYVLTAIGWA